MKKTYEKPDIIFESFELARSIAAGCECIATSAAYVCPVTIPDEGWGDEVGTIFVCEGGCDRTDPGDGDQICYENPTEDYNVYSS